MASIVPDPKRIRAFKTEAAFEKWLAQHHDKEPELWLQLFKKGSGVPSITAAQALDVCLCWGWIDAIRKSLDESSFLQRYVPRGKKSSWSQINREHVARLIAAGRMTPHGQKQIDAARADGRWDAAYAPASAMTADNIPADLRAAIEKNAAARRTLAKLDRANLFALSFRLNALKTEAGRQRKIQSFVELLARGETLLPLSSTRRKET